MDLKTSQDWLCKVSTSLKPLYLAIQSVVDLVDSKAIDNIVDCHFGISAKQRLAIYHFGYLARLLECLRAEYPILCFIFSDDWLNEMGKNYLSSHPSKSWDLGQLGKLFPKFIAQERPDRNADINNESFDFIITLAQLERYQSEVARSKGVESNNFSAIQFTELMDINQLNIELSLAIRLLKSDFEICYYVTNLSKTSDKTPVKKNQFIILSRMNYVVSINSVKEWQFYFIQCIQRNKSCKQAVDECLDEFPNELILGYLPIWISKCVGLGIIATIKD